MCTENRTELESGLLSENQYTRTLCIHVLLNMEQLDVEYILRYAKQERVPHLRWVMYRKLVAYEGVDQKRIIEIMLTDTYARIRNCALLSMEADHLENTFLTAIDFLLDDHVSVRDTARWIVSKYKMKQGKETIPKENHLSSYDFKSIYRSGMKSKPYVSIRGLGEIGDKDALDLIQPFLQHSSQKIVRGTMRSLMQLAPDQYAIQMVSMLGDSRIGIVKEAFTQLLTAGFYNLEDEIYESYQSAESVYSRERCLLLLFRCSKWKAVLYMLEALADPDHGIREFARTALSGIHCGTPGAIRSQNSGNLKLSYAIEQQIVI